MAADPRMSDWVGPVDETYFAERARRMRPLSDEEIAEKRWVEENPDPEEPLSWWEQDVQQRFVNGLPPRPPRYGGYTPEQRAHIQRVTGGREAISNGDGTYYWTTPQPAENLIVPIDDYRAKVPAEVPWICRPIAYSGGVTLIAGPPKAGKSTLAAQLQQCRETGAPFVGAWPVQTGPVLLVTEEGGVAVVYKTNGLHRLEVLDRRAAAGLPFDQVLAAVGDWGRASPGGLAFIDTLAIWAEVTDENDATQMTRAIALVTAVAQATDLAVVLIHHARKAGGDNGEAIRGSGAILATVDIAVELARVNPGDDDRWLDVQGRVILPERYLLGFDRLTMTYSLKDRSASSLAEIEGDLTGVPDDGPGLTRNDLQGLWQRDPRARADQLVNLGRMRSEYVKTGRAYAWRYWSIPAVWTPPMRESDD